MALAPKKELYFLLEQKLAEQSIVISDETITEGMLGLTIENAVISFGGASVATASKIEIWSLLLYTQADFTDLQIAKGLSTEVGIDSLDAIHSVSSPMQIDISASTTLGAIEGRVDIAEGIIRLDIIDETKSIKRFQKYLKKDEKGWYYEQKI